MEVSNQILTEIREISLAISNRTEFSLGSSLATVSSELPFSSSNLRSYSVPNALEQQFYCLVPQVANFSPTAQMASGTQQGVNLLQGMQTTGLVQLANAAQDHTVTRLSRSSKLPPIGTFSKSPKDK